MVTSSFFGRSLLATGIGCFGARIVLSAYFMDHRPGNPHADLGQTFAFNQHGAIVYLTHWESVLLTGLFILAAIFVALGAYMMNNPKLW